MAFNFTAYLDKSESDFKELWKNALFIFDTNTLTDIYRLPNSAKADFLKILSDDKIKDRIWLPHQVMLEFLENRLTTIADQKTKFKEVKSIINSTQKKIEICYSDLNAEISKLQLKKRHSVIDPDKFINKDLFNETLDKLNQFIIELEKLEEKQPDVHEKDEILKVVLDLFKDKIGDSLTQEGLDILYKEGEQRYKDEIPPGFKDKSKPGFYKLEGQTYIRKFGDLIVWKELIEKTRIDNLEYVIFITNDNKEDWWLIKRGKTIGPRLELLKEIYHEAPNLKFFQMYDSSNFMKYCKENLLINVDQKSINETKDLIELRDDLLKDKIEIDYVEDYEFEIDLICIGKKVKPFFENRIHPLPVINMPFAEFRRIIIEIITNIQYHSKDKKVTIGVYFTDCFVIRFRNQVDNHHYIDRPELRGRGIPIILDSMLPYGHIDYFNGDEYFEISLFIEKEFII